MRWLLLLLVCVPSVVAESVVLSSNVSISCDGVGTCVVAPFGGSAFLFSALNGSLVVNVSLPFTYNSTVFQNVTVNVTYENHSVEVVTQNVTVMSCNQTSDAQAIAEAVVGRLPDPVRSICTDACKVGMDERLSLKNDVSVADLKRRECELTYESQLNISKNEYQHLNETCQLTITDLETNMYFAIGIVLGALCVTVIIAVYVLKRGMISKIFKGKGKRNVGVAE